MYYVNIILTSLQYYTLLNNDKHEANGHTKTQYDSDTSRFLYETYVGISKLQM